MVGSIKSNLILSDLISFWNFCLETFTLLIFTTQQAAQQQSLLFNGVGEELTAVRRPGWGIVVSQDKLEHPSVLGPSEKPHRVPAWTEDGDQRVSVGK